MRCSDCGHARHEANQCKRCNCGDAEVSHSDALASDERIVIERQDFISGMTTTRSVNHIRARKTGWD